MGYGKPSPYRRFIRKRVCDACVRDGDEVLTGNAYAADARACERCGKPTPRGRLVQFLNPTRRP